MEVKYLIGSALNWAVAVCESYEIESTVGGAIWVFVGRARLSMLFDPINDWGQAGPIIEREHLDAFWNLDADWWSVSGYDTRADREVVTRHPSLLVAAMRCYVSTKLGREIELPEGLI